MSLVPLLSPESEAELLTTVALLEAHGIPCHVRGGGFGSLYPGPQVSSFNSRTIMIPSEASDDARELLHAGAGHSVSGDTRTAERPAARGLIRMVAELLMFGWFVPGRSNRRGNAK